MSDLLNQRALEILRHVVDAYVETGEPIGSKTLSNRLGMHVSSATIRNVMARLEEMGMLYAPHTSAGRLPTDQGLRFFVNALLETGTLTDQEKMAIELRCTHHAINPTALFSQVSEILSGLSSCAGIVVAPKSSVKVKHVEFIRVDENQGLMVLVTTDGAVENRIIDLPSGLPPYVIQQASNYLNDKLAGYSLEESKSRLALELQRDQQQLDSLACKLVEAGFASWNRSASLIVHGQSNLLKNVSHMEDLESIKGIFSMLETKESLISLLDAAIQGEGVQIFIGAENDLFRHSGCSLVLSPYADQHGQIVGAIGVIGPTRINYGKIIPMVDYTAKIVSRLLK